jgi:hypothetical protein
MLSSNILNSTKRAAKALMDADKPFLRHMSGLSDSQNSDYESIEGLKPFHKHSTDIAYSRIPKEDIIELYKAIGVPNINIITTIMPKPARSLLHSSLNMIQTRLRIDVTDEAERGAIIAEKADTIYTSVQEKFDKALTDGKLPDMPQTLEEKLNDNHNFVKSLINFQKDRAWDAGAFDEEFSVHQNRERHENKSIETFRAINERIASGQYQPSSESDAGDITHNYMQHNVLYKHLRKVGCSLVDEYLSQNISDKEKLTLYPEEERKGIIICGGMGSGKSWLSSTNNTSDIIHQNADYVKIALHSSAVKDGKLDAKIGLEATQNESSNVVHESRLTRCHDMKVKGVAPNVQINAIMANDAEIQEFLGGKRGIEVQHVSMDTQKAIEECNKRAMKIGRKPNEEAVKKSYEDAARSLTRLTKYKGKNVRADIYERTNGSRPELNAVIDCNKSQVVISDMSAFLRAASRSNFGSTPEESSALFVGKFKEAGFEIIEKEQNKSHTERLFKSRDGNKQLTV